MFAGHRLATALGTVDSSAVLGTDEASRKQLVRAGEAMVDAELAIVLNRPGTKIPMCTLTAIERKRADQAAQDEAAASGDPLAHRRSHPCGLAHAITDRKTATRVLNRITRRERPNLGVEPRASRVLIVDLDTAKQAAEFAMRCGQDRPTLTVRSPGQRDKDGNWAHRDGGHIWLDLGEDDELPVGEGIYTDPAGWSVIWGEHQVLVPPSARAEGAYVLVGSTHPAPQWLLDLIATEAAAREERRRDAAARRAQAGPSAIDDWAADTTWAQILTADGWTETGLVKNCGCPQWTAPGEHASPESATAHEPGCSVYVCERGHGPLHVWTDSPSAAVAAACSAYGTRTLTMIQVLTYTEGAGQMGATLAELGIPRDDGPTVIAGPFPTWDEAGPAGDDELDDDEGVLTADEVNELSPRKVDAATYEERMVAREYDRLRWQRLALDKVEAEQAPRLTVAGVDPFLDAARPRSIFPTQP